MMQLETFFTVPEQTRLLIFAVLLGIPLGVVFAALLYADLTTEKGMKDKKPSGH